LRGSAGLGGEELRAAAGWLDVVLRDGRIQAIGDLSGVRAVREIDARGLAVAP
jgi:predicted amidohydrolase